MFPGHTPCSEKACVPFATLDYSHSEGNETLPANEDATYTPGNCPQWQTNLETPASFEDTPPYRRTLHLVSPGVKCIPRFRISDSGFRSPTPAPSSVR